VPGSRFAFQEEWQPTPATSEEPWDVLGASVADVEAMLLIEPV
jgi:hypothetical protein